jgi:ABC-2 type transport system ATP-binding protein
VDEVLDIVGLLDRSREPAKRFSLGMKQRLGIAAALLPDPELLVLDEPTNGLDPAGIVEVRQLLRSLGDDGRTVIVSSHLLGEIEAACDSLAVIRHGELLFSGPLSDLVTQAGECIEAVPEHPGDVGRLAETLTSRGWKATVSAEEVHVMAPVSQSAAVNRAAAEVGITLRALRPREASLEEVFLRMTGSDSGDNSRPTGRLEVAS